MRNPPAGVGCTPGGIETSKDKTQIPRAETRTTPASATIRPFFPAGWGVARYLA
jgi:hypothetical protein